MSAEPDNDLNLETLRRPMEPPAALEARVLERVRAAGLVRSRVNWISRAAIAAAAAVLIFGAGELHGRSALQSAGRPAPAPVSRFALFLYDDGAQPNPGAVDEYRRWARDVRERGHEISGEKLNDRGTTLLPSSVGAEPSSLGGYFIIGARDYEDALGIARSCPHLNHGGRIEVRPIDPT